MIYLSSTTGVPEEYKWNEFGIMLSATRIIGGQWDALEQGAKWMMDSGAYSGKFNYAQWKSHLEKLSHFKRTCLGIPTPDVVGDSEGTLQMFSLYSPVIRELGLPVAFVSQDGCVPDNVPWSEIDVLFVGGTDEHKLGKEAIEIIKRATTEGKHIHVGRVNSKKRMRMFRGADSVDGTTLSYVSGGDRIKRANRFAASVRELRA